ncbi:MAG: hypothetical protein ACKOWC_01505, partial [Limnohabitans sp.]
MPQAALHAPERRAQSPVLALRDVHAAHPELTLPLQLDILPGLTAITGDEGTGKTTLLRLLAGQLPCAPGFRSDTDGLWLDLRLPDDDDRTPEQVWTRLRGTCPRWSPPLQADLVQALALNEHLDKRLFMLSTGSRRKVALVALLASGSTVTCIDQPYAALDTASA